MDFTPGYGATDSYNDRGVTRASQESWLGGRPMSGVSDIDPDMLPPMEEVTQDGHMAMSGAHTAGYYDDDRMLSPPMAAYPVGGGYARTDGSTRRASMMDSSYASHGYPSNSAHHPMSPQQSTQHGFDTTMDPSMYYDGSAAAGYHTPAARGQDLAGAERAGATSPYEELQRGYDHDHDVSHSSKDSADGPELAYAVAYGGDEHDQADSFGHGQQGGRASAMGRSSSRWSG